MGTLIAYGALTSIYFYGGTINVRILAKLGLGITASALALTGLAAAPASAAPSPLHHFQQLLPQANGRGDVPDDDLGDDLGRFEPAFHLLFAFLPPLGSDAEPEGQSDPKVLTPLSLGLTGSLSDVRPTLTQFAGTYERDWLGNAGQLLSVIDSRRGTPADANTIFDDVRRTFRKIGIPIRASSSGASRILTAGAGGIHGVLIKTGDKLTLAIYAHGKHGHSVTRSALVAGALAQNTATATLEESAPYHQSIASWGSFWLSLALSEQAVKQAPDGTLVHVKWTRKLFKKPLRETHRLTTANFKVTGFKPQKKFIRITSSKGTYKYCSRIKRVGGNPFLRPVACP